MTTYPLSETEYAIYSGNDRNCSTAYDLPVKIILEPNTDMEKLENAIHKVIRLNPALNTSFGTDENGETYKYHRTNNKRYFSFTFIISFPTLPPTLFCFHRYTAFTAVKILKRTFPKKISHLKETCMYPMRESSCIKNEDKKWQMI